jgi:predicted RNA binding protein YcfA (HicA-like mRNA interferase family)
MDSDLSRFFSCHVSVVQERKARRWGSGHPQARRRLYGRLQRIGWREKTRLSKSGSHRQFVHPDSLYEYTWAFHDSEEIGP